MRLQRLPRDQEKYSAAIQRDVGIAVADGIQLTKEPLLRCRPRERE